MHSDDPVANKTMISDDDTGSFKVLGNGGKVLRNEVHGSKPLLKEQPPRSAPVRNGSRRANNGPQARVKTKKIRVPMKKGGDSTQHGSRSSKMDLEQPSKISKARSRSGSAGSSVKELRKMWS